MRRRRRLRHFKGASDSRLITSSVCWSGAQVGKNSTSIPKQTLGKMLGALSGTMAPEASEYSTKRLTKNTLPDFERLFEKHPAPGAFSCWCTYHHRARPSANGESLSGAKRAARNRQRRRELVENGSSHGILVYSKDEPVGWCQYGLREELPRFDNYPSYRQPARESGAKRLWRITCFTVDRKHRQQGVASSALKAALQAIRDGGGGIVEAYPIIRRGAYREYLGTVSMFQKEGFKVVAPFGKSNVVMRRSV